MGAVIVDEVGGNVVWYNQGRERCGSRLLLYEIRLTGHTKAELGTDKAQEVLRYRGIGGQLVDGDGDGDA